MFVFGVPVSRSCPSTNWINFQVNTRNQGPRISSTELREKFLREKLVAKRRTTAGEKVGGH